MDMVAAALTDIHHLFFPLVQQLKHLVQGIQKGSAAGVQADFALDPVKKGNSRVVLHPGDDLAQGGWVMCSTTAALLMCSIRATVRKQSN